MIIMVWFSFPHVSYFLLIVNFELELKKDFENIILFESFVLSRFSNWLRNIDLHQLVDYQLIMKGHLYDSTGAIQETSSRIQRYVESRRKYFRRDKGE